MSKDSLESFDDTPYLWFERKPQSTPHDVVNILDTAHKSIELPPRYKKIHSGKVRDTYEYPDYPEYSIIVATDRVSTHDVVHDTAIPNKGVVLTQMSYFWFNFLKNNSETADIKTHIPDENISLPADFPAEHQERAMVVKKLTALPAEAIVRGFLYGSVLKEDGEYTVHATVGWESVPTEKQKCYEFPTPIFAPSTKGKPWEHDENMTGGMPQLVQHFQNWECPRSITWVTEEKDGRQHLTQENATEIAEYIKKKSILIFQVAQRHAKKKDITLGDTKLEWALDLDSLEWRAPIEQYVILIDEVLTPDSSRYWESHTVVEWSEPSQFDKQPLRDDAMGQWKKSWTLDTKPPLSFSAEVVAEAQERYLDIQNRLTAK